MKKKILCALAGLILLLPLKNAFGQFLESQRLAGRFGAARVAMTAMDEKEFGAIPALTGLLGSREIIPNINLIGAKNFRNKNTGPTQWYGTIRVFTGSVSNNKVDDGTGASAMFIPDASTFGFTSVFSKPVGNAGLALNLAVSYLGKNLKPDTATTISFGMFHGKGGLEYIIHPEVLSLYINVNSIVVSDHTEEFEAHYINRKSFKNFIDYGARLNLDASSSSDLTLVVDLNFIAQNGDVNGVTKSKDLVIPVIKIGLKKSI